MSDRFGIKAPSGYFDIKRIANKSHSMCAICGLPVNIRGRRKYDWNIDHIVPRCVLKWPCTFSRDEHIQANRRLIDELSSRDNMVITHPACNENKGCVIPTEDYINTLHINRYAKKEALSVLHVLRDAIYTHRTTLSKMLMKQHGCCYVCKKALSDDCAPRRLDETNPIRDETTGVLLCPECLKHWGFIRRIRKL